MGYEEQAERIYPEAVYANNPEVVLPKRWQFLKVETVLKRDPSWSIDKVPRISDAAFLVDFITGLLFEMGNSDRERVYAVFLDQKNAIVGLYELSIGTATESLVGPSELFRSAILSNATGIIVVHNHPSGKLDPSQPDVAMSKRLNQIGDLLGVRILDFIIIGPKKTYFSFQEKGMI